MNVVKHWNKLSREVTRSWKYPVKLNEALSNLT